SEFARRCREAGLIFVGPKTELLEQLGDKVIARRIAQEAGGPGVAGRDRPGANAKEAEAIAAKLGYPIILKAAHGGGGRGMRVVNAREELAAALEQAQRESQSAFGSPDTFLEKFIQRPRHIEVQLLGDQHGQLVHLFER